MIARAAAVTAVALVLAAGPAHAVGDKVTMRQDGGKAGAGYSDKGRVLWALEDGLLLIATRQPGGVRYRCTAGNALFRGKIKKGPRRGDLWVVAGRNVTVDKMRCRVVR